MNAFSDTNTKTGGASERFAEYMRKTLKISLYALSVNKVFIVLMLVLSLLIIVISRSWWFVNAGESRWALLSCRLFSASLCRL